MYSNNSLQPNIYKTHWQFTRKLSADEGRHGGFIRGLSRFMVVANGMQIEVGCGIVWFGFNC